MRDDRIVRRHGADHMLGRGLADRVQAEAGQADQVLRRCAPAVDLDDEVGAAGQETRGLAPLSGKGDRRVDRLGPVECEAHRLSFHTWPTCMPPLVLSWHLQLPPFCRPEHSEGPNCISSGVP